MKKPLIFTGIILAVALSAAWIAFNSGSRQPGEKTKNTSSSHKDATYIIEGRAVTLANGVSEMPIAPGSASKIMTRYFGNEVKHDFDGDGREDVAFLLTQETAGSGTFYYVVAALNTEKGYIGSHGLFLGDRVAPQATGMSQNPGQKNVIVVNYAERAKGESFAVPPSVGKSRWLLLDVKTMQFGEVARDFEGEADPSRMTLGMKTWEWVSALYNDGKELRPKQLGKFTITFSDGGKFSATTDCNQVGGSYTADSRTVSFGPMVSTKMYCEGSQEAEFTALLGKAQSYHFTSKGELIIDLKFDSGSAVFK